MVEYVIVIQYDSLIAPQHPKNAIRKIIHPIAMVKIGAHLTSCVENISAISPTCAKMIDPIAIKAIPHSYIGNKTLVHSS